MSAPTIATDRRAVLRFAAAALLVPLVSPAARAHDSSAAFRPPHGPMRYTRRLERGLADGESLVVSRTFEVRFLHQPDGFRIEGEQVAVEVTAPDALASFAQIERERQELSLFPILLDAAGYIAGTTAPMAARLDAAVREAVARIESRSLDEVERAEQLQFVNAIHQTAGKVITELPRDLFAPVATPRSESREVALPGGVAGAVTVTFSAARDPATGLMRDAVREVVTRLGGDRRRTVESWRLARLD